MISVQVSGPRFIFNHGKRAGGREIPNFKLQMPIKFQVPNLKFQKDAKFQITATDDDHMVWSLRFEV
jgi:hypothetical protein